MISLIYGYLILANIIYNISILIEFSVVVYFVVNVTTHTPPQPTKKGLSNIYH